MALGEVRCEILPVTQVELPVKRFIKSYVFKTAGEQQVSPYAAKRRSDSASPCLLFENNSESVMNL